jgi:hypothetical protein
MAHFAQLDKNNNVINISVISNVDIDNLPFPESEPVGIALCQSIYGLDTIWKQTSYNNNFRRQYAIVGGTYYAPLDVFVGQKPYSSWVFQTSDATWQAPIPQPTAPTNYLSVWNEQYMEWDFVLNVGAI